MKKVIATVGTSIFTNCEYQLKENMSEFHYIKDKRNREWNDNESRIKRLRTRVAEWVQEAGKDASAEIKSLIKLKDMEKDSLDVTLLATDTIASRLAADIIREAFEKDLFDTKESIRVRFNAIQDVIEGLQVENYREFVEQGAHQFIRRISQIAEQQVDKIVFNISGGYKGLVPFMTFMALVNGCDLVYIYEESDTLIKIPKAPIAVDESLAETYYRELKALEQGTVNYRALKQTNFPAFQELEERGLVEALEEWAFLSPIGRILLENFENRYGMFCCNDEVWEEIQKQPGIQRILTEKFFTGIRQSKTEFKGDHTQYDDGNNDYRIFYFEDKGTIYIYKTFENEEESVKYIATNLDREKIIRESTLRKWRIRHV